MTDIQPADALRACAADARTWLFDAAAPLWSSAGRHDDGMFAEILSQDGIAVPSERRTRVQARQIYAYCEIGRLGWTGPWRDYVGAAVDRLIERGPRGDGFFVYRFGADGLPSDTRADLYDSAFVIFAMGHAARALDRPELIDVARAVMAAVERDWGDPHGGFGEGELVGPPRRQNPHMHLLEAAITLWLVTGDRWWADRVGTLSGLARDHFIDPATGALTEYFGSDWSRADTEEGRTVEPGHCFEWSWLFEVIGEIGLGDPAPSDRLAGFARAHGLSAAQGVAINEVRLDGSVKDGGARLWPQTERLKAALARWRRTGEDSELIEAVAAYKGLKRYLDTPVPGLWYDKLTPEGGWIAENAPASSFYHIVCSLYELITTAETV